jgi:hypothetical protein
MLAQLAARDAIEPPGGVAAVEVSESATRHQKNLLCEVLEIGLGRPQRSQPLNDGREPGAVEGGQGLTGVARCWLIAQFFRGRRMSVVRFEGQRHSPQKRVSPQTAHPSASDVCRRARYFFIGMP